MAARVERIEHPLIVIVGPTASGKTALAIDLARRLGGEIICADSRTIYKGMDVGTAKPTREEQVMVPHWGLDIVSPGQPFSVADFKTYAEAAIADIRSRGQIPIMAGGSGLYIDAVLFDYSFGDKADSVLRAELEKLSLRELHEYCSERGIAVPENHSNKRYVVRAIERQYSSPARSREPISGSIIVGIATDRSILRKRIAERSGQILENGVVEEAIKLAKIYGWQSEAMTGNIYPLIHSYLKKELTFTEVKEKFTTADWRLARRQLTWLRSNPYIVWQTSGDVAAYIDAVLAPA